MYNIYHEIAWQTHLKINIHFKKGRTRKVKQVLSRVGTSGMREGKQTG
jgi:hypothetical protein